MAQTRKLGRFNMTSRILPATVDFSNTSQKILADRRESYERETEDGKPIKI